MIYKSKKELVILAGLLVLLTISVISQYSKETLIPARPDSTRSNLAANSGLNEGLAVDLLSSEAPEFSGVKRNIFQFASGVKSTGTGQGITPVQPIEPLATVTPAMPEVLYLGFYFEKETGLKMASLSNSGRVYVGKVGQVLGGKYKVLQIAADHVVLQLLNQEGKILRVPLGKSPATYLESPGEQDQ